MVSKQGGAKLNMTKESRLVVRQASQQQLPSAGMIMLTGPQTIPEQLRMKCVWQFTFWKRSPVILWIITSLWSSIYKSHLNHKRLFFQRDTDFRLPVFVGGECVWRWCLHIGFYSTLGGCRIAGLLVAYIDGLFCLHSFKNGESTCKTDRFPKKSFIFLLFLKIKLEDLAIPGQHGSCCLQVTSGCF